MSYSDFTLQTVVKELQLMLNKRINLFAQIPESTKGSVSGRTGAGDQGGCGHGSPLQPGPRRGA
jgi:hypothetical protein